MGQGGNPLAHPCWRLPLDDSRIVSASPGWGSRPGDHLPAFTVCPGGSDDRASQWGRSALVHVSPSSSSSSRLGVLELLLILDMRQGYSQQGNRHEAKNASPLNAEGV